MVRLGEEVRPTPVAREQERAGRRPGRQGLVEGAAQIVVRRRRVAHVEAQRLPHAH